MKFRIEMNVYRWERNNHPVRLPVEVHEIRIPNSSLEERGCRANELVEDLKNIIGDEAFLYRDALMTQLLMHDESLIVIQEGEERGVYPMDYSFETYRESKGSMTSHMPRRPWVSDFRGSIFPKELLSGNALSLNLYSIRTAEPVI